MEQVGVATTGARSPGCSRRWGFGCLCCGAGWSGGMWWRQGGNRQSLKEEEEENVHVQCSVCGCSGSIKMHLATFSNAISHIFWMWLKTGMWCIIVYLVYSITHLFHMLDDKYDFWKIYRILSNTFYLIKIYVIDFCK